MTRPNMTITSTDDLSEVYYIPFDRHDPDLGTDMLAVAMARLGCDDPDNPEVQDEAAALIIDWLHAHGEDVMYYMVDYLR